MAGVALSVRATRDEADDMKMTRDSRLAGVLVPVFALRHGCDFGIGDTQAVRDAIDFCSERGFAVLQTLPIHETIGDHSPYNPITSRGLAPAYLSLTPGEVPGLTGEMLERLAPAEWLAQQRAGNVRHGTVHALKLQVLLAAHRAFRQSASISADLRDEFVLFQSENASWLPAYTLFRMLVREYEGNASWMEWRPEHHTLASAERWLQDDSESVQLEKIRESFAYVQWVGWRQWRAVREYASSRNVQLMGEVSFGVSRSSVDVWAQPELFDLEWNMGTPPIVYFDTNRDSERFGQNWGFPPYRWENHRVDNFAWLRDRLRGERQFFHICRLDHLRGYFRAYMFPWGGGPKHAEISQLTEEEIRLRTNGRWPRFVPGSGEDSASAEANAAQGRELISIMRAAAGDMFLFAEIMGNLPDYMAQTLDDLEIANLTFPQLERFADRSLRPPSSYRRLSLAAYANHDHAPLAALYTHLQGQAAQDPDGTAAIDLRNLLGFAGWLGEPPAQMNPELLAAFHKALFATPCLLTVLLSSDLLGIPQRFNLPGTYGNETWCERLEVPLSDLAQHPHYGPRLATAVRLLHDAGRAPKSAPPD